MVDVKSVMASFWWSGNCFIFYILVKAAISTDTIHESVNNKMVTAAKLALTLMQK